MRRSTRKQSPRTARIDLAIAVEAQVRFDEIHKALGYKTKPETFEAIVFTASMKGVIDPGVFQRMNAKLDHALEILDSMA